MGDVKITGVTTFNGSIVWQKINSVQNGPVSGVTKLHKEGTTFRSDNQARYTGRNLQQRKLKTNHEPSFESFLNEATEKLENRK